ncbi:hypothetical protein [Pontixanthobacter sp.]|uniref:hypothetical protein n=1 Tax=Pontixanthobacter sp. TaxID=2792078 RepID=UPI003C7A7D52
MKNFIFISSLALILASCSPVNNTPLPTSSDDPELKVIADGLSEGDKKLLIGYLMRREMAKAFGGNELNDGVTTVGEALDAQRQFAKNLSDEEKRTEELRVEVEAKRKAVATKISKAVTIAFVDAEFVPSDFRSGRYEDFQRLTFAIKNISTKPIKAVKGEAVFIDTFGDEYVRVPMQSEDDISPGESKTVELGMEINKFMDEHKKVMQLDKNKKFRFVPDQIVFGDGTTLKAPDSVN